MTTFVPAVLAKVSLIFAAGLIIAGLMRGMSPAVRHLVLLASLVCGLTLPAVMAISPRWNVGVLPSTAPGFVTSASPGGTDKLPVSAGDRVERPNAASIPEAPPTLAAGSSSSTNTASLNPATPIALIWVIGVFAILTWLGIGRWRLRRIAREAWPLDKPDWQRTLEAACVEAGVTRKVLLLSSPVVSTPLTWGTRRPVILLPEDALDWTEEHRRVVLRHEIAHVARGDSLVQLGAGFVCAIYWFHPLIWVTERRLRAECERACDDRVVSLGTSATDYAAHLLEVARAAQSFGASGFLSVAMARPSQLEGRLLSVLNESRNRVAAASRGARWTAAIASVLVMLPLAAFTAVPRSSPSELAPAAKIAGEAKSAGQKPGRGNLNKLDEQPAQIAGYDPRNESDTAFTLAAAVQAGGTLEIDLRTGGGITIESWDKPQVLVNARLAGRSWRETRVTLEPSSTGAMLVSDFAASSRNQSTSHDFDIRLPRRFNVRIESAGGRINIANMSGEFTGQTGGGQINLQSVNGRVDLRTGGGQIHVLDSNLDGDVSTGGGQVHIVRVNGHLNGWSGSGPVIRTDSNGDVDGYGVGVGYGKGNSASVSAGSGTAYATAGNGPIIMSAPGGAISLASAPNGAHVTTGGGRITIGSAGGSVYAETGGGDVQIGPTAGSVDASTGAGDVDIDFRGRGSVDVTSGKGRVTITAPSELNANLELITAYTNNFRGKTRIISDWPVSVSETREWDDRHGTPRRYVIVRQQIGDGGPLIRVNTVNGDIVLRKRP